MNLPATQGDRRDATRERLLTAAVEIFGQRGFEGTSTRLLASGAGVNLQAIAYHFGSKEGLYLAASSHIAERIKARVEGSLKEIGARLSPGVEVDEALARQLLAQLLQSALLVLAADEAAAWGRFIVREQMEPTPAFDRIYEVAMAPILAVCRKLVGIILQEDPESDRVRIRTIAVIGQILVFRLARATILREMSWSEIRDREIATIKAVILEAVESIAPAQQIRLHR